MKELKDMLLSIFLSFLQDVLSMTNLINLGPIISKAQINFSFRLTNHHQKKHSTTNTKN